MYTTMYLYNMAIRRISVAKRKLPVHNGNNNDNSENKNVYMIQSRLG